MKCCVDVCGLYLTCLCGGVTYLYLCTSQQLWGWVKTEIQYCSRILTCAYDISCDLLHYFLLNLQHNMVPFADWDFFLCHMIIHIWKKESTTQKKKSFLGVKMSKGFPWFWQGSTSMPVLVPLSSSDHHMELNLRYYSKNAGYVLMDLANEITNKKKTTDPSVRKKFKGISILWNIVIWNPFHLMPSYHDCFICWLQ